MFFYSIIAVMSISSISASQEKRWYFTLYVPEMKIAEFANSVDLDEVAHYEPPHLDLHCLPSSL